MTSPSGRAVAGVLSGGVVGAVCGILLGGILGFAVVQRPNTIKNNPDPQAKVFSDIADFTNACFGFFGGLVGAAVGGIIGSIGGSTIGARLATRNIEETTLNTESAPVSDTRASGAAEKSEKIEDCTPGDPAHPDAC